MSAQTRRVLANPLSEEQTKVAARIGMYFLVRDVQAQHSEDGAVVIPAGRWVYILPRKQRDVADAYDCTHIVVATPGTTDPQRKLNGRTVFTSNERRPFRIVVLPEGKELDFFFQAARAAQLLHIPGLS
jgi:hypothetical protein